MKPIQFLDYDKLSDDVLYLGPKCYLRMNVSLSKKKEPDTRYHYHREFVYSSPYGTNDKKLVSMRRSFDYFLSIDIGIERGSIIILPQDMILLRTKLAQVQQWFDDGTFGIKENILIIVKKRSPIVLEGLVGNKYIQFDPIILAYDTNQTPGVRLTLGDQSFVDITVDKFYALLYTINEMNLYQAASELVNYLGRPGFGLNIFDVESLAPPETPQSKMTGGTENRKIKTQSNRSFFDTPIKD